MGFRTVEKANKPLVMVTVSIMFLRAILKRTVEVPASWKHQECVPKQNRQDFWIIHFPLVRSCSSHKYSTFIKKSFQTLDFIYNDNFIFLLLRK